MYVFKQSLVLFKFTIANLNLRFIGCFLPNVHFLKKKTSKLEKSILQVTSRENDYNWMSLFK